MGTTDRMIRIIIAITVGILYSMDYLTGTLGAVLIVLAGVFVLTSIISFCPLYTLFGLKTCSINKE